MFARVSGNLTAHMDVSEGELTVLLRQALFISALAGPSYYWHGAGV